jgi:alpha-tubulin suppressor-like RCC1 family protein
VQGASRASGVTAVAAGYFHSLALKRDGTVVAWGCGGSTDSGQCGVPSGLSGVTAVAAGNVNSLALKGDGTVVAWGCGAGRIGGSAACPAG